MYQRVTLADLQTQLFARVENKPYYTTPELTLALNQGLRLYNAACGRWVTKHYITTVPNDPFVPLPVTMSQSVRCLWDAVPMEKCSLADLDYGIPGWRGATTATGGAHPSTPVYWAPVSLTLLVIYPADAVGLNTLEVAGVHATPLLVNANDYVDLGEEEHDVLLAYAQHVLAFKVGGQVLVASYPGWLNFLKALGTRNRQFAATTFYRRVLGLDMQRRLRRQQIAVTTPVDQALADAQKQLGG